MPCPRVFHACLVYVCIVINPRHCSCVYHFQKNTSHLHLHPTKPWPVYYTVYYALCFRLCRSSSKCSRRFHLLCIKSGRITQQALAHTLNSKWHGMIYKLLYLSCCWINQLAFPVLQETISDRKTHSSVIATFSKYCIWYHWYHFELRNVSRLIVHRC